MPELPEVETICEDLDRLLSGQKIIKIEARLPKQIKNSLEEFNQGALNKIIKGVRRRAKFLIIDLNDGQSLLFHLKMTGQLIYRGPGAELAGGGHPIKQDLKNLPGAYTHVIFDLENGGKLFFNDLRQFGFVKLVGARELLDLENNLGPEPLDKSLNPQKLAELFKNKARWEIKPALMEQKMIVGIGNIYASEICFAAGLAPNRLIGSLTAENWAELYREMIRILNLAIEKRGTSSENYVDAFGREGSMNQSLKVYGRAGQPCARCGKIVRSFRQKQRTTFWCEGCQK